MRCRAALPFLFALFLCSYQVCGSLYGEYATIFQAGEELRRVVQENNTADFEALLKAAVLPYDISRAICQAVADRNIPMFRALIARPEGKPEKCLFSPLYQAIEFDRKAMFNVLLNMGFGKKWTEAHLRATVRYDRMAMFDLLLEGGLVELGAISGALTEAIDAASMPFLSKIIGMDLFDEASADAALKYAISRGRNEMAKSLIGSGMASKSSLSVALVEAVHRGLDIVDDILNAATFEPIYVATAIYVARVSKNMEMYAYLVERFSGTEVAGQVFFLAVKYAHMEMFAEFVNREDVSDKYRKVALLGAILLDHTELFEQLLHSSLPADGLGSALIMAVSKGRGEIFDVLMTYETISPAEKRAALRVAVSSKQERMAIALGTSLGANAKHVQFFV